MIGNVTDFKKIEKGPEHLSKMNFKPDFTNEVTEDLIFDDTVFEENKFTYEMHQQIYVMHDGSIEVKSPFIPKKKEESRKEYQKRVASYMRQKKKVLYSETINFFDSAYCISVHKSQGSEFDNVVVIDESWCFEEPEKWLYTAITRAKKRLVIIK